MNAHTPGPWAVHEHCAYVVPTAHVKRPIGGSSNRTRDLAEYAQEICALQWPDRHRQKAEVKANARLIAAAPELLAALQAIADIEDQMVGYDWVEIGEAREIANAAIAKVTGEPS